MPPEQFNFYFLPFCLYCPMRLSPSVLCLPVGGSPLQPSLRYNPALLDSHHNRCKPSELGVGGPVPIPHGTGLLELLVIYRSTVTYLNHKGGTCSPSVMVESTKRGQLGKQTSSAENL